VLILVIAVWVVLGILVQARGAKVFLKNEDCKERSVLLLHVTVMVPAL